MWVWHGARIPLGEFILFKHFDIQLLKFPNLFHLSNTFPLRQVLHVAKYSTDIVLTLSHWEVLKIFRTCVSIGFCFVVLSHRVDTVAWLSWPRFHASLNNIPPLVSSMWSHHASPDPAAASNAFSCNFADNGHRNYIQLSNLCAMSRKAISKITFNIRWNLKQIWRSWHIWVSKSDINGVRE